MIVLFTDFGADDIYVAQMKAVLLRHAPAVPIIDLLHRAPNFDARSAAHLLGALQGSFPGGAVFIAVVDPGVGSARDAVVLEAERKWYVGPDNGLLSVIAARTPTARTWRVLWRPETLSRSFHGRDLFAPVAAWIAAGQIPVDKLERTQGLGMQFGPDDLAEIIYIDHYGNALTGLRAGNVPRNATIEARGRRVSYVSVFSEAPAGTAFWYENSIGLVEIAVNRGSAANSIRVAPGDPVRVIA